MRTDYITKVCIDESGRLCVFPETRDFAYIYRSAMEVHWDVDKRCLYSPPPRNWNYVQWFQQILDAAADEYGYSLLISDRTLWQNIEPELKKAILAVKSTPQKPT